MNCVSRTPRCRLQSNARLTSWGSKKCRCNTFSIPKVFQKHLKDRSLPGAGATRQYAYALRIKNLESTNLLSDSINFSLAFRRAETTFSCSVSKQFMPVWHFGRK